MRKLFTALIFLFSFCSIVNAKEYIDTYHVDITILNNGNLSVTENIKVRVEWDKIRRGIYRWFSLKNVEKYQRPVPYMNLRVTRNGRPEKIGKTEKTRDSIAYYIGDKKDWIEAGATFQLIWQEGRAYTTLVKFGAFHEYAISYEVDKAILQFDESDQLYWNIIPFFWEFPIHNISATVKFPENADYLGVDVFSGSFGSEKNELNVSYSETSDGISFQATEFESKQGLTAIIKFDPSLVPKAYYNSNFIKRLILALLSIAVIYVTVFMWYRVGREKTVIPTVFPQFYPPENISVLAARYILRQGNVDSTRMLTIALVSLAAKGIVKLDPEKITLLEGEKTWVERTQNKPSKGERLVLKDLDLIDTGDIFVISEKDEYWGRRVREIGQKNVRFAKKEFSLNIEPNNNARKLLSLATVTILAYGGFLVYTYVVAVGIFLLYFVLLAANLLFFLPKLKNYSKSGGQIVSQLEGLKMYILAAEHQSLSQEPEPTPEQFSKIYPYAFAMGLNTVWADKFSKKLAEWASVSSASTDWYNSYGNTRTDNFENSLAAFDTNFSEATNYSPPSSSDTGSGGGGGGGGGGGW